MNRPVRDATNRRSNAGWRLLQRAGRRLRRPTGWLLRGCVLCCWLAWSASSAAADGPPAVLRTLDGSEVAGRVMEIGNDTVKLRDAAGQVRRVPLGQAWLLEIDAERPGADAPSTWMLFANGDRAAVVVEGVADDQLICRWSRFPDWEPMAVPLELVRGVILQPPDSPSAAAGLIRELTTVLYDADTFRMNDGSLLTGELAASTEAGFMLETSVGSVTVRPERARALAMNSTLIDAPSQSGKQLLITLTDGSWMTCDELRVDEAGAGMARSSFGWDVAIEWDHLKEVRFLSDDVRLLSEMEPAGVTIAPYVGPSLPMQRNRNVLGGFLRVDGPEYPRGLGMLSGTTAHWELSEQDRWFSAVIGIDAAAGSGGSAEFVVELDGRPVYSSGELQGANAPVRIGPLTLKGGRELTLKVEFGAFGNSLDYADWCDAVLLRDAEPRSDPLSRRDN